MCLSCVNGGGGEHNNTLNHEHIHEVESDELEESNESHSTGQHSTGQHGRSEDIKNKLILLQQHLTSLKNRTDS